ncbi:hypothetical protein TNCV_1142911 [Trichonephila clavipes]|nr:hypothetical protein TNCV_1142911 [Trichonephila clavipes]
MFNENQKVVQMELVGNLISAVAKDPSLLGRIVTGDERWRFYTIPQQSKKHRQRGNNHYLRNQKFRLEEKSASQAELQVITKNGFQICFDDLYKQWEKCIFAQGSYFEKEDVSLRFN